MIHTIVKHLEVKRPIKYSFLALILITFFLVNNAHILPQQFLNENLPNQKNYKINVETEQKNFEDLCLSRLTRASDSDVIFPTFLYLSIEIANLLIENLYDNVSNGFYFSIDEEWREVTINSEKRTYDNAQAILGLLKLAEAVINQTESDFALNIAESTANGLLNNLWDPDFDGFFISPSDRYKKPGIHGKAIQAFLALYEETGISSYREIAIDTLNFIDRVAWNDSEGYYIYVTSHTGLPLIVNPYQGDPYEPQSLRVDHNSIMGIALLDFYRIDTNSTYLTKACRIYDIINETCRNSTTNLFYTGVDSHHEIVYPEASDLFINSLVLEFLAQLYNVTEDQKYYEDFFILLNTVLLNFWDNDYGGFISTRSSGNFSSDDRTKFTERQFYGIEALDKAYKLTNNDLYYNLILDTIEILNTNLYDQINGGYYQLANPDGSQSGDATWKMKVTVTQSLGIYTLANIWLYSKPSALNVIWSPTTPRPQDKVSLLIAAFDPVGISTVFLNYSIDGSNFKLLEMVPHLVKNMFICNIDPPYKDGTSINFNIIITNANDEQVIRGDYSFLWQFDRWPPEVQVLGFLPGIEIPVNEEFTIIVTANDIPSQGSVRYVRIHYYLTERDVKNVLLNQFDVHLWKITFPEGLPIPGTYTYYFESSDLEWNPSFSHVDTFTILGSLEVPFPLSQVVFFLLFIGVFVPTGLYSYVEYKKKSARKKLKVIREVRNKKMRRLNKRGTKRT